MIGKRIKLKNKIFNGINGYYIVKVSHVGDEYFSGGYQCFMDGKMTSDCMHIRGSFRWDEVISIRVLDK